MLSTKDFFQGLFAIAILVAGAKLAPAFIPAPVSGDSGLLTNDGFAPFASLSHVVDVIAIPAAGALIAWYGLSQVFGSFDGPELRANLAVRVLPPRSLAAVDELPPPARALVLRIRRTLEEIHDAGGDVGSSDDAYTARATAGDYLSATMTAFLAIPESRRSRYTAKLVEQLTTLDAAASRILDGVANDRADVLSANGSFLAARFARPIDALRDLTADTRAESGTPAEVHE
jgi:hypothetical protein